MRVSNYTGQVLLGIGVALLAALFVLVKDLLRHWRVWHLPLILVCMVVFVLIWRAWRR